MIPPAAFPSPSSSEDAIKMDDVESTKTTHHGIG